MAGNKLHEMKSNIDEHEFHILFERPAFFDVSGYPNLNTQGFYFDKPLPVDEFEKRLKDGYVVA